MTTNTTNSQVASIADDIKFWNLIEAYGAARGAATKENAALCAYIDAKVEKARQEGVEQTFSTMLVRFNDLPRYHEWHSSFGSCVASDKDGDYVEFSDVLALLQPQGQSDTSGLPG